MSDKTALEILKENEILKAENLRIKDELNHKSWVHNGWIERGIRKFAIGRNNWRFCDTVAGARALSLFYSLVITAKLNSKDPFKIIYKVLREIPSVKRIDDYEKLAQLFSTERMVQ